jgi:hypothetical protein
MTRMRLLSSLRAPFTNREFIGLIVVGFVLQRLADIPAVSGREWWVMPPLAFAAMIGLMLFSDRRKPITAGSVVGVAIMSVAIGVFLRIT